MTRLLTVVLVLVLVAYSTAVQISGSGAEKRLIQTSDDHSEWMTADQVEKLARECGAGHHGGFMDITEHAGLSASNLAVQAGALPSAPTHQATLAALLPSISPVEVKATNDMLTKFYNRYYDSADGEAAALALKAKFESFKGNRDDIAVSLFEHRWKQPSVIARIEGSDPALSSEVVILSAHEDSISTVRNGRAPGADDDASGCSTVMEAYRVLATSGFKPSRSIEFHLYSGEEVGLLGSQDVAEKYQSDARNVYAQLQLDMTFYTRTPGYMGIINDYVDADLTAFLRLVIADYTELQIKESKCGYGCSDHASWTKAGYRACFPFEAAFNEDNPYIHSTSDVWEKLDLDHGVQFIRLALGFAVELSL